LSAKSIRAGGGGSQSIFADGDIRGVNGGWRYAAAMNLAAVDLNVLVALDAILSEVSVTRAAARIGRSQPATSHALNRARELFGDPLLVRMRGALQLTPRARGLAPRIRHALAELASTMETHGSFRPADVDVVTIGATDYVGFVLLPHLIKALQREAPNTSVRVRTIEGRDALEPVAAGLVDVALGTFPHVPAGLRAEVLFHEQFVCLLRKGHPRRGTRLSIDQYSRLGHVLVTSPWDGRGPVDDALERLGRHRKIAAYVPHFLVAPSIVAETDLVLTTGRRIAEQLAAPLGLTMLPPPVKLAAFVVRMVWHPRTEEESVGQWLRAVVRAGAAALPAPSRKLSRRNRSVK
jgi:DNA-binding transcriptional LysR family regulator